MTLYNSYNYLGLWFFFFLMRLIKTFLLTSQFYLCRLLNSRKEPLEALKMLYKRVMEGDLT